MEPTFEDSDTEAPLVVNDERCGAELNDTYVARAPLQARCGHRILSLDDNLDSEGRCQAEPTAGVLVRIGTVAFITVALLTACTLVSVGQPAPSVTSAVIQAAVPSEVKRTFQQTFVSFWANVCPTDSAEVEALRKVAWPRRDAGVAPKVEKIIYLNLDWDTQRRAYMENQLMSLQREWEKRGQTLAWERLEAVGREEMRDGEAYSGWRKKGFNLSPYPDVHEDWAVAGCAYSHYLAIKQTAKDLTDGLTLIVEDDVEIKPEFLEMWSSLWPWIPQDWDVMRVGWFGDHQNCSQVVNAKVDRAAWQDSPDGDCAYCGAQAYIVNPASRQRVLARFEKSRIAHADELLGAPTPLSEDPRQVPPLNAYVAWPMLAATRFNTAGFPAFPSDRAFGGPTPSRLAAPPPVGAALAQPRQTAGQPAAAASATDPAASATSPPGMAVAAQAWKLADQRDALVVRAEVDQAVKVLERQAEKQYAQVRAAEEKYKAEADATVEAAAGRVHELLKDARQAEREERRAEQQARAAQQAVSTLRRRFADAEAELRQARREIVELREEKRLAERAAEQATAKAERQVEWKEEERMKVEEAERKEKEAEAKEKVAEGLAEKASRALDAEKRREEDYYMTPKLATLAPGLPAGTLPPLLPVVLPTGSPILGGPDEVEMMVK